MRATLTVLILALAACKHETTGRDEATPLEVHCEHPLPRTMERTIALRGRIAPPPGSDVAVASQVLGRIARLDVHEGDHVEIGTTIATIDDAPSRDALSQADSAVVQARANVVNADASLDRIRELVKRGIAAKQELDDAVSRADQAHAALTSAAAASDLARRTLGHVQVRSAFAGTVTRIFRGPGALVDGTAQTPIAQLAATDAVELLADVTERDLMTLLEGQPAHVTLTNNEVFDGQVRAVGTALDPATGLGLARLSLALKATRPRLGEFGVANVVIAKREVPMAIPETAIRGAIADGATVAVCKDGKAELRKVMFGDRDTSFVEITSGLAADETVAIDHVLGLEDGTPIAAAKASP